MDTSFGKDNFVNSCNSDTVNPCKLLVPENPTGNSFWVEGIEDKKDVLKVSIKIEVALSRSNESGTDNLFVNTICEQDIKDCNKDDERISSCSSGDVSDVYNDNESEYVEFDDENQNFNIKDCVAAYREYINDKDELFPCVKRRINRLIFGNFLIFNELVWDEFENFISNVYSSNKKLELEFGDKLKNMVDFFVRYNVDPKIKDNIYRPMLVENLSEISNESNNKSYSCKVIKFFDNTLSGKSLIEIFDFMKENIDILLENRNDVKVCPILRCFMNIIDKIDFRCFFDIDSKKEILYSDDKCERLRGLRNRIEELKKVLEVK